MIGRLSLSLFLGGFLCSTYGQIDWPAYGHDPGRMRHSPLTQIHTKNVLRLKEALAFHAKKGPTP